MEITNEVKQRIVAAIAADRENYPSDNRHATALGIAPSVYNAIKRGNYEKQVSDANWVGIARRLGVQLRTEMPWLAAQTPTYVFVSKQLEVCQGSGLSAILCDMPNYRQDLQRIREAAQARRICGLQPGEDQVEADTLHCQGIRCDQQRTLQRRV